MPYQITQQHLTTLVAALRERRLKRDVDYAFTVKYGQINILCLAVWTDTISEVLDRLKSVLADIPIIIHPY